MSRPSREYASSISKLMFSSASTFPPSAEMKVRLTLRTVIFAFLGSIWLRPVFRRFQVRSCARNPRPSSSQRGSRLAPGKENALQKSQQKPKEECRDANRDNPGIDTIEIQHFAGSLDHVADALAGIQHFGKDHVGPPDVVENPARRENGGERDGGT